MPYTRSGSPREGMFKKNLSFLKGLSSPERSRREGRSHFDERSVRVVGERERRDERHVCEPEGGKRATPDLANRSGKARERRWRPFDQDSGQACFNIPIFGFGA